MNFLISKTFTESLNCRTGDEWYWCAKLRGLDVLNPQTGKVESCNANGIACWFKVFRA
jgi:hypothetical protein